MTPAKVVMILIAAIFVDIQSDFSGKLHPNGGASWNSFKT